MNQKTVLTPMQLFFCAKLMDAVYYDYAYLAAMPDVQKEYALHPKAGDDGGAGGSGNDRARLR